MKTTHCNEQAFFLYMETKNCSDYGLAEQDEIDPLAFEWETFTGKRLPPGWKAPKHELGHPCLPLLDFVHGHFAAPYVSKRVVAVLKAKVRNDAEFRYVGTPKEVEYYVLNVLLVADCLDKDKSIISYSPDEPSRIIGVDSFVFDPCKIPDALLFKVPQDTGRVFATPAFVDLVRQHRWTGVGFEDAAHIGISVINRVFEDLPFH